MIHLKEAEKRFREGLDELLFVNPVFGSVARSMGVPVWGEPGSTAAVRFDPSTKTVQFEMSPEFIENLSVEEVAGLIAHEVFHVVLNHLPEVLEPYYTHGEALYWTQEAIANDTIVGVLGMRLPEDKGIRGMGIAGQDFSSLSTMAGYDILMEKLKEMEEEEQSQEGDDNSQDDSQSSDSGGGGSADGGAGSSGDETPSDEDEKDDSDENGQGAGSSSEDSGDEDDADNDSSGSGDSKDESGEDDSENNENDDSNSGSGDEENDDDEENEESADSGESDSKDDENGESSDQENDGDNGDGDKDKKLKDELVPTCGGIVIPDGYDKEAVQAMVDLIKSAAKSIGMSDDEMLDEIHGVTDGGFSTGGAFSDQLATLSKERMNWRTLLGRINPKVLEAGKKRRRQRSDWTRSNRRLISSYPKVILPVRVPVVPKPDPKGDSLPVFVVALDLSGSIPRHLVDTLQGLLDEIPEDLIQAYPATWGTNLIPYVKGERVASGNTNFEYVIEYVKKIKKETGTEPYVLVITDGAFRKMDTSKDGKEWFWMAVDNPSVNMIKQQNHGPHQNIYLVDDFMV